MSSLASVLKKEIARLARKEVRAAMEVSRKSIARQRTEISQLRKRVKELESLVAKLQAGNSGVVGEAIPLESSLAAVRFSPKSMRSHPKRLGLSAENYAKILGVSMQTVYHWEQGKSRPRQSQLQRLAAVRKMGKREALKQLALPEQASPAKAKKSVTKNCLLYTSPSPRDRG